MKCVQIGKGKNKQIKRINDDEAYALVKSGEAKFVPKETWKKEVRDYVPGSEPDEEGDYVSKEGYHESKSPTTKKTVKKAAVKKTNTKKVSSRKAKV